MIDRPRAGRRASRGDAVPLASHRQALNNASTPVLWMDHEASFRLWIDREMAEADYAGAGERQKGGDVSAAGRVVIQIERQFKSFESIAGSKQRLKRGELFGIQRAVARNDARRGHSRDSLRIKETHLVRQFCR